MNKHELGQRGEEAAASFLGSQGYIIVEKNKRTRSGELDLVCTHPRGHWCFVEVKTVQEEGLGSGDDCYDPVDKLSRRKIHKLHHAIVQYLGRDRIDERWQLDAVVVYFGKDLVSPTFFHLEHISRDW